MPIKTIDTSSPKFLEGPWAKMKSPRKIFGSLKKGFFFVVEALKTVKKFRVLACLIDQTNGVSNS